MLRTQTTAANNTTKVQINLTVEEWDAFSSTEKADLFNEVISVERAKKVLIVLIGKGDVVVNDSKMFARWTNKRVVIKSDDLSSIQGYNSPTETLSKEEFEALTPIEMVEYIKKYVSYDRAKTGFRTIVGKGLPISIEQAMEWSNGRLEFEGIAKVKGQVTGTGKGARKKMGTADLAGLTLNGHDAPLSLPEEVTTEEAEALAIPEEEEAETLALLEEEVAEVDRNTDAEPSEVEVEIAA